MFARKLAAPAHSFFLLGPRGVGKSTWVLLQHDADWRWLLDRSDSPWYPSVRLFRRRRDESWPGLMGRVRDSLHAMRRADTADPPDPEPDRESAAV